MARNNNRSTERSSRNRDDRDEPKIPPQPRGLGSSLSEHPGREGQARARLEAIVRAEMDFEDEDYVQRETDRRLEELKGYRHPKTLDKLKEFGLTQRSQRPSDYNDKVGAWALRRLPQIQQLEELLSGRTDRMGAPSDRRLMVAVFLHHVLTGGKKEAKAVYEQFTGKDDLLDAAFDHPVGDGTHARAYNSITTALGRQLNHHDPDALLVLNADFLRERRKHFKNYGKHVAIDGTSWQAHTLQAKRYSEVENLLLKRDFSMAEFGYHGEGKGWRGYTLLHITCLESGDVLGWCLVPANGGEKGAVEALMLAIFAVFPEWEPEVLVGDKEYDAAQLYVNLLSRFGVHLVCPLKSNVADDKYEWVPDVGVPRCSQHGEMTRIRDREFPGPKLRKSLGLRPGQPAPVDRARIEWRCDECPAGDTTYFKRNPRLYTYYPHKGGHVKAAERAALQVLRNMTESVNANLQHHGFGLKGQSRCRWVSTDAQAAWLAGGGLLAMNLRKLIYGDGGLYEQMHELARDRELLKPRRKSPGALTLVHGGRLVPFEEDEHAEAA